MSTWRDHLEGTTEYSLRHLWPFVHNFRRGGDGTGKPLEEYRVVVLFGDHCFTGVDESKGDDTLLGIYLYGSGQRRFSMRRYELSKRLPDIIRDLPKARCLNEYPDYLVFDLDAWEVDGRYEVYFKVIKTASGMLQLIVKSAYFRTSDKIDKESHSFKPINFFTILHKVDTQKK